MRERARRQRAAVSIADVIGREPAGAEEKHAPDALYTAGPMPLPLRGARVALVGTRRPSAEGARMAGALASELAAMDAIVVSGMAAGIDTAAHEEAIRCGGRTVAVIATPTRSAYPPANARLQAEIAKAHLLVSQFPPGTPLAGRNFAMRNRTMALISEAVVIVEAARTGSTVGMGWEASRLRRPLFISGALAADDRLGWPSEMIARGAAVITDPAELGWLLRSAGIAA